MQAAKKLVLVDEFDREYKRLQRPVDAVAKTGQSLQLSDTLRDNSIADDRKVREYVAALHRYLNVRKEVPAEPKVEPHFAPTQPPAPAPPPAAPSRRRKHQASPPLSASVTPPPTPRRRRRKPRQWTPY